MKLKEYNDKIDVIIPAYNVPDKILSRCLASIAMQECIDDVEVTIVDDASTEENYEAVIKNFEPMMKINLLRMEVNGGPGVARQYGLDHTKNGLITFVDADDTLANAFALSILKEKLQDRNTVISGGYIIEEFFYNDRRIFSTILENDTWIFGKIFKREFIDEYGIRFHPSSRANEDAGFNKICSFCLNEKGTAFSKDAVYCWHYNSNSITRNDNHSFELNSLKTGSMYGYIENMSYVISYAKEHNLYFYKNKIHICDFILDCLLFMYENYTKIYRKATKEDADNIISYCSDFYKKHCKEFEANFTGDLLRNRYVEFMQNEYNLFAMDYFYPIITFEQFLYKLKGDVQ